METEDFLPPTIREQLNRGPRTGVRIHAWVRSKRTSKNVSFLQLNDGSCLQGIQAVFEGEALRDQLSGVENGAAVACAGDLIPSQSGTQQWELQARSIELYGSSPPEYPLQKKRHSLEFLREIIHLRSRTNTIGAATRVRSQLSRAVHEFFQTRGFFYIHTPIITLSDAEGAGEMFSVESTAYRNTDKHFFSQEAFLTVSGQLEGEVYAHSHGRIYTFGPTFRAEESNTPRHLAEFWMIEPEVAFCNLNQLMQLAESFIRFLITKALEDCAEDLEFFDLRVEPGLLASLQSIRDSKAFVRISYTEAVRQLQKSGREFVYPPVWGESLQTEHERFLTEECYQMPTIVYDYPAAGKAFYMKQNDDGQTVRGMDLLVPRLGEIIGGSERENDYTKLKTRMESACLNLERYQWYLDLRRFGGTPHSGFGLGFERLIQYITGIKNIRDVIPFPRAAGQAF